VSECHSRSEMIESLFHEYGNAIYRYVKYSLPEGMDAADVVQEVFLRAFRSWDDFEGRADVKTWLYSIARNLVYDLLRKRRNERKYLLQQRVDTSLTQAHLDSLLELTDSLARLADADRQVLNLRLIQDLSVAQTAAVLNWSEMKVKVNYHRARKRLQAMLAEPKAIEAREQGRKGGNRIG